MRDLFSPHRFRTLAPLRLPAVAGLLAALALAAAGAAQPASPTKSAGPLPDLDVAYISIAPRYPAYQVEYPDGLPQPLHPETGKPLSPDAADRVQRWPRVNELVTAAARVVNHGMAPSGPFTYTWLLDGRRVGAGRHPGLAPNCEAMGDSVPWKLSGRTLRMAPLRSGTFVDLPYTFRWPRRGRRLELQVRLESGQEVTEENNSRAEQTDAWSLVAVVHRRAYNAWNRLQGPNGGSGFEDWVQKQLEALRAKFDQSAYPSAPSGVRPQLRLDVLRVLDDEEELSAIDALRAGNGWDCAWAYADHASPELDSRRTDWSVIKSWCRQLGLIDLNRLALDPERNEVRDAETGRRVDQGYVYPGNDPMSVPGDAPFSEHSVLTLNAQAGKRRGYDGVQLYDVPRVCRVRVLDNNGRPVPDAGVTVYQASGGRVPAAPIASGKTDSLGAYTLPNRPAPVVHTEPGPTLMENPFGLIRRDGTNGLLLLCVAARSHAECQWLTVLDCNVAFWHGQTSQATFDLHTRIPASTVLAPPAEASARVFNLPELRTILVDWKPAPGKSIAGYFIYRATYPTFRFEKIGAVSALRMTFLDPLDADSLPGDRVRYAVSSVDQDGNESGLSGPFLLSLVGDSL